LNSDTQLRTRSREYLSRAQQSLVEGVNSPSRGVAVYSPGPIALERGHGSHVWDVDGNEYLDFMMSFGALIQGHAHPKLVELADLVTEMKEVKHPYTKGILAQRGIDY
jgi:glutamate-1-semialdehyde 2,1-aminomutase